MSNYFEVEVEYRPETAELDEKLKPFIGLFGNRVKGVWTTDGADPKPDGSNFDYSLATEFAGKVRAVTGGTSIGGVSHTRYAVFGKSYGNSDISNAAWWNDNSGITKSMVYEFDWYNSNGVGKRVTVINPHALGFIVGKYRKNDDGSVDYRVWWAVSLGDGVFEFEKWTGTYTIITDVFGDTSEPDDEPGDYDDDTDDVPIPPTPTIDMCDVGLVTIWKPTISQLHSLGNKLWSKDFIDNIIKSFYSPMDSIVTLNIVPSINKVQTGGTANIKLGNYDTGIPSTIVTSQFIEVDMGTYTVTKYWASALDYNPYTMIYLFLPYIGFTKLSPDDVMGKTIHVVYKCDIVTGQLNAMVAVKSETGENVLYTQTGNFSMNVPVTGANYTNVYKAAIQASVGVLSAGSAVATGGAAGLAMAANDLGQAVSGVASSKIDYQHGSSSNMSAGYLGVQKCYLVISRPRQSLAENYNSFVGYPSNITSTLGSLKGFTQVESIHLENIPATDEEKSEIEQLLKAGVII